MYRVNDATKSAYKSDVSHKEVEIRIPAADITLTNEDIVSESLELKEAIENSGNLSFQGCIASSLKFECFNLVDETLEGMWIEADITADETDTIPLFRGYISEVTNATHEEFTTVIRAYDALQKINNTDVTAWYNGLTFPMSILNLRNSFFAQVGITQVADYLPNDGIMVQKTIEDKVIMGGKVIKAICQINGRFGRISRDGLFEYVHLVEGAEALYPREDLYPADDIYPSDENALDNVSKAYYTSISFENYRVASITKVQIIRKDGQIASTAGSGSNVFTLKDNPLAWELSDSALSAVATNLYNTIKGLWYTPSEIACVGLPYIECGDFVLMAARRSIIRAYVLGRTLKGIQAITDAYQAEGDRTQPVYIPDIQAQTNANAQAITNETANRETAVRNEASARDAAVRSEASARASADASEASTRQSQINAVNVRCDNLNAKDAQIENLVATKASISQLDAANGRIDNLSSNVATINSLVASKASIDQLNAANARIANLEATRVTADWVSSRFVTASQVSTAVHSAMEGTVTCGTLRAAQVKIYTGQGYTDIYNIFRTK